MVWFISGILFVVSFFFWFFLFLLIGRLIGRFLSSRRRRRQFRNLVSYWGDAKKETFTRRN